MGGFSFQREEQAQLLDAAARPVAPPREIALAAVVTAAVGAFTLLQVTRLWHLVGYVFSSLITISLVAAYRQVDARRRRSGYYSPNPAVGRAVVMSAVVGVVAAGVHAWYLARLMG